MKHPKLRIAWSVAWGILALPLIALWVRSYWWADTVEYNPPASRQDFIFDSIRGRVGLFLTHDLQDFIRLRLTHESITQHRIDEWHKDPPKHLGFDIMPSGLMRGIFMPIWFPISMFTAASVLPWLRWSRFSLRSLLIALTLIALGLGLIAWTAK